MRHGLVFASQRAGGRHGAGRAGVAMLTLIALLVLAPGCARRSGLPAILTGTPCAACGMGVSNKHFACERQVDGSWRVYDSIECLVKDAAATPGGIVYLADYDTAELHPADSLWIVRGDFSTPMGGGLAAFLHRGTADTVAVQTNGRVGRFEELAKGGAGDSAAAGQGAVAGGLASESAQ